MCACVLVRECGMYVCVHAVVCTVFVCVTVCAHVPMNDMHMHKVWGERVRECNQ